jgi:hypothetical protein
VSGVVVVGAADVVVVGAAVVVVGATVVVVGAAVVVVGAAVVVVVSTGGAVVSTGGGAVSTGGGAVVGGAVVGGRVVVVRGRVVGGAVGGGVVGGAVVGGAVVGGAVVTGGGAVVGGGQGSPFGSTHSWADAPVGHTRAATSTPPTSSADRRRVARGEPWPGAVVTTVVSAPDVPFFTGPHGMVRFAPIEPSEPSETDVIAPWGEGPRALPTARRARSTWSRPGPVGPSAPVSRAT